MVRGETVHMSAREDFLLVTVDAPVLIELALPPTFMQQGHDHCDDRMVSQSVYAMLQCLDGAVEEPVELDFSQLLKLPQVEEQSDFHCVTAWSLMDSQWRGVQFSTLAALARPHDDARFVMTYAYDGYTTNLPLEEALKDDVLVVYARNGEPLSREHGGPVRMITPQLYAWKCDTLLKRLELMKEDRQGFWEVRGYSNSAHPWRDDRYS